jgi:hypothetical protein
VKCSSNRPPAVTYGGNWHTTANSFELYVAGDLQVLVIDKIAGDSYLLYY